MKGQTTLYVILGLVLLALVGAVVYLFATRDQGTASTAEADPNLCDLLPAGAARDACHAIGKAIGTE